MLVSAVVTVLLFCSGSFGLHFWLSELEEDGIRIALTIVNTPGFGDNINNEAS